MYTFLFFFNHAWKMYRKKWSHQDVLIIVLESLTSKSESKRIVRCQEIPTPSIDVVCDGGDDPYPPWPPQSPG